MYLKSILLQGFRNLPDLSLTLHPRFSVLVGENAQGKTNIIEGIYLFSFGKSFRVPDYRDLIAWGQGQSFIRSWVHNDIGEEERQVRLTREKKTFYKNDKPVSPNQFLSIPMVLFSPEAILLLKESPQARRDYIDNFISKCLAPYGDRLKQYKRALAQRNKILKDEFLAEAEKEEQAKLWEKPMREHGIYLIEERKRWLERLNRRLVENYTQVAGAGKKAGFVYQPNVAPAEFEERQAACRSEEMEKGMSLVGPHRDDFQASLDDLPVKYFGSQGENRTFTLALKLAEISLFEETLGFSPVLLLDDVVSELDERRSEFFFSRLKSFSGQVFATATSLHLFPKSCLRECRSWQINQGHANPIYDSAGG
ncbi:MAG: DNA replication and repair protein RecF, partial [Deltaproteobacteria bacterium]|nr:DNA replication and repair protein RecF [Deltaproteobacteria bacterium]